MTEKLTLTWSFTPADFFEDTIEYSDDGWTIHIENGRITATFSGAVGEKNDNACRVRHEEVSARFLGAQLLNHRHFRLSDYITTRTLGGHVEVGILAGATLRASVGHCDVLVHDAEGNVTVDTKKERVEARKALASRAAKYWKDPLALGLLKSYNAAVNDPQNELTHLYEIQDALETKFNGELDTCSALGFTKNDWNRMGRVANNREVAQGRHRGRVAGQLRDATPEELSKSRSIAKLMIERYFDHLDGLVAPKA